MDAEEADDRLRRAAHPADWINPEPAGRYDLVVIGGGTAGLICAIGAAGLGARVALVERALLGGDCLNTGCVPSKALLRSARAAADARRAGDVGIRVGAVDADFGAVMRRLRERRADLSPHDAADRLRAAGIDVYFGVARFTTASAIDVGGRTLRFRRAAIAAGGRPAVPPLPGLESVAYLTSDTLFALTDQPRRLAVVGAGPVGCEMAQAFARLGTEVILVDQAARVLPNEDADAAAIVARRLAADGVTLRLGLSVGEVSAGSNEIRLRLNSRDGLQVVPAGPDADRLRCTHLLIAAGRLPNLENLDLPAAGIASDRDGVVVDDHLRTSNRRVFAAGDVSSKFKFTHAADALARIVIQNALFFGRKRASSLLIPWCTYTDPEVAHVGAYEATARQAGRRVETITIPLTDVDRAVVDEEREGFLRIHHERGRLLGCTVVSSRAGEMIGVASHALTHGASLRDLGATIYPYPTLNNAFRAAGDAYNRGRLTPRVRRLIQRFLRLT
jgi:pyruvate/2-oxoglutarate dehydrogenase complex dihydrolipoamide dehydrogenase (E3) component